MAERPRQTPPPAADEWFVSFDTSLGEPLKRKLTTRQVLDLIKDPDFDLKAQASRTAKGPYRSLGSFEEFEQAIKVRMAVEKAERVTGKGKKMYEQVLEEDALAHRRTLLQKARDSLKGGVGLVVWVVFLAALCYGGWLVVSHYMGD